MTTPTPSSRADPIDARVALINGQFDLPAETVLAMSRIREILATAASEIDTAVRGVKRPAASDEELAVKPERRGGVAFDHGRLQHTMDLLQEAKDTACVSVILPHYK